MTVDNMELLHLLGLLSYTTVHALESHSQLVDISPIYENVTCFL